MNTKRTLTATLTGAVGLLLLGLTFGTASADEALIEERQDAYSHLDDRIDFIEYGLGQERPNWGELGEAAREAQRRAEWLQDAFPEGTSSGSRARGRVWSNWEDFSERLMELSIAMDQLATAVENQDLETAEEQLSAAARTCRGCHMRYRSIFAW